MEYEFKDCDYEYDFIIKAVVISYARSRSIKEVAALLCVPPELLEKWKEYYSKKIKVQYLPNKYVKHKRIGRLSFSIRKNRETDNKLLEKCPECGKDVTYDSIKCFQVQQAQSAEISNLHSWAKGSGGYPVKFSVVNVTTERIERCPECGLFIVRYVTERLPNSEV